VNRALEADFERARLKSVDARRQQVLQLVVEAFISQNRPVPSRDLAQPLGVSSATVRFELAALEEMGLLHQPHTSAGRVPTREAFRAYAHRFIPPKPLSDIAKARITGALGKLEGENRLRIGAQLASSLSGYAAVAVLTPREAKLEAILLSALPDGRVLAVLILEGGIAREIRFDPGFRVERATLERVEEALRGAQLPVQDVPNKLKSLEISGSPGVAGIARALRERWGEASPKVMFSSGASPVLMEPESQDVDFLRRVLELLEHPASPSSDMPLGQVGLAVDDPHGVSAVTVGFKSLVGRGNVVIIGPTRMRYPQVISVAKAVSDALGAA
jgi:heat-inducible transcriptional repressor